jgi:hypothetical protein
MPKHIKLFKQYNQFASDLITSIYENWKSELSADFLKEKGIFNNLYYAE